MSRPIRLIKVRQNNLKNITVEFPAKKLYVITGLSGSGKSSLAFDTLYAEGQRRYIESLSTYTRQFLEKMPKPDLDTIESIPPAIALEQRNHVLNSRSTVGTQTEIVDYLRILYAKIGHVHCSSCGGDVKKLDSQSILDFACQWLPNRKAILAAPLGTVDVPLPAKQKKSSAKAKSKKGTSAPKTGTLKVETYLQILAEQGFRRLLWKKPKGEFEFLDLDELDHGARKNLAAHLTDLFIVIDRIRLNAAPDPDTRGRLLDSIEQGLAIGKNHIAFVDLDTQSFKLLESGFNCLKCGKSHRVPEPHTFSFNSPLGACPRCSGFGFTLDLDEALIVPDPTKTLKNGAIDPLSKPSGEEWQKAMFRFAERHGISVGKRYSELTPAQRKLLWEGDPKDKTFAGILGCFEELKRYKYKLHVRVFIRRYQSQNICPDCQGARLKPDALFITVGDKNIADTLSCSIIEALEWIQSLTLSPTERQIVEEVLHQVIKRLQFLNNVGVGYLTLARLTRSLSGGEFQRINLATQLGNGLCGTLYVLDEPSIGLHAADTDRLIGILERLRDQGNTVVVVEHDLEVMRRADWLIELGPGAGRRGGELIIQGTAQELSLYPPSLTGKYLSGAFAVTREHSLRAPARRSLRITGCRENNLQKTDAEFPLDRFVVVTGVSGSGKSTLVHKTLFEALSRIFYRTTDTAGAYEQLYGADQLSGVVLLDQTPIGKSSRSNPATYIKAWDEVRRIYAAQVIALRRGYTPQHFSFNVEGGRCPVCKGEGEITLDMHFMAEVKLPCEECGGKRFKKPVLDVAYRGKDISQLLHTTIDDAFELFRDNSILVRKLGILRDVGLGYLQLGQSATTLSGGESQRLKIASSLEDKSAENLLYVFDEPTTGLHLEDIKKLLGVVHDLIDAKNSVIMIEHHLDVIAQADWVIDLGPGGGANGGQIVATGTPAQILKNPHSMTGKMLEKQGYRSRLIPESAD